MTTTDTAPPTQSLPPVPVPVPAPPPRRRIRTSEFKPSDAALVGVTLLSAVCAVWIVFAQLTLLSGVFGFIVAVAVVFLVLYYLANRQLFGRRVAADRVTGALVAIGVVCMLTPLVLIVGFLFVKGFAPLVVAPADLDAEQGAAMSCKGPSCVTPGVFHAIVGTFEQVGFAVLLGVPAGILDRRLFERGGRPGHPGGPRRRDRHERPAGHRGRHLHLLGHRGLDSTSQESLGLLAFAVLLLPTVTRGTEEVLKIVPNDLREASAALGAPSGVRSSPSRSRRPARHPHRGAAGHRRGHRRTAPLLFTVFGSRLTDWNLFSGPQASLPLLIYTSVKSSQNADVALGYTAALVLFLLVFLVFILARILGSPGWAVRSEAGPTSA